jgi:nitrate reductase NapE component
VVKRDVLARSDVAAGRQDVSQRSGRETSPAPQAPGGSPKSRRNPGGAIFRVLRGLWIPLVILAVIGAGGFTVSRLHGIFGSEKRLSYADTRTEEAKPFNPKHLKYEVFGPPGTVATISYMDVDADPQHVEGVRLPWSLDIATTLPAILGSLMAQGDSDSIGCRILVDGVVKAENSTHEVSAFTSCVLKAG